MIRLDSTTKKLQAVLGGAITTNQLQCVVSFFDENPQGEDTSGASKETNTNSTTDVDICSAPSQNFIRNIDTLTVYNRDTVSATVTVKIDDGGTETILINRTLAPNDTLTYDDSSGWNVVQGTTFLRNLTAYGGRLTLASATPVMTSDQTAKTTVYFTPYNGDIIPIYDGTNMVPTQFTELSQATTDTTKSPAAVTTNSNYDLFVWNDSGTIRLSRGPAWSSSTSRGTGAGTTELEMVKGVYLNKVAITNGPAANRGTYVGTVRSNGSSQIDWKLGSEAAGGGEAFLGVWNMYNRVDTTAVVRDSTNSWSYTSATIRSLNNSTTNRISAVTGLAEDSYYVDVSTLVASGATSNGLLGIGLDSTSANSAIRHGIAVTSGYANCVATLTGTMLGFHFFQALDVNGNATDAVTRYGKATDTNVIVREALIGEFKC